MVQIITDSSVLYTEEEARKAGFEAVPLCVHIGDLEGRDLQIDMKEFYHRIEAGQIPMSSQPPIGEVVDLYEKYQDSEIINIAIADGLSGTYYGACSAKEMVENRNKITVFNSRTLCGPHRYMVEVAQKMKKAGKSVSEILDGTGGSKNRILFDSPGFFFPEERWEIDPGGSGFRKCFETEAGDEADG